MDNFETYEILAVGADAPVELTDDEIAQAYDDFIASLEPGYEK